MESKGVCVEGGGGGVRVWRMKVEVTSLTNADLTIKDKHLDHVGVKSCRHPQHRGA